MEAAKRHLLDAGRTEVKYLSPDLTLADELVDKRERDAVVEYLRSVGRWWDYGRKHTEG